jgi:hypothetical protein
MGRVGTTIVSRGLAAGYTIRAIARTLNRAASTMSQEVSRHGGRELYRAAEADLTAVRILIAPSLPRTRGVTKIYLHVGSNGELSVTRELHSSVRDVRRLLGRSRRPPIRGHTSSVPRHGLRGVGGLKQLPKPVCQQFDGLPQGAELPNPDYRDGSVQVKRWGTQYLHGIDGMIPGNKASG